MRHPLSLIFTQDKGQAFGGVGQRSGPRVYRARDATAPPTSPLSDPPALSGDEFTARMFDALNGMLLDILAAIAGMLAAGQSWRAIQAATGCSRATQQIDLDTASVHIRRAKNGTPGIHGLQGDEMRLLRALRRDYPHADFVFLSERCPEAH
jgi:hypothetical protein